MKILILMIFYSLSGWADTNKGSNMDIKLRVGSNSFTVTLIDNERHDALKICCP